MFEIGETDDDTRDYARDNPNHKFPRPACVCHYRTDIPYSDAELPEYVWDTDIDRWVCPLCADIY
jgi:hypothetical protein